MQRSPLIQFHFSFPLEGHGTDLSDGRVPRRRVLPLSESGLLVYAHVPLCTDCKTRLLTPRAWNLESELLYDWRFTADQFVLATSPLRLTTSNFICQLNTCGYSLYVTSSLTRGWVCRLQLLLVLVSAVILRFESRTLSDLRLPQRGGPGPRICIPQEQGSPVIPAGTGFPFRRLLRLAGLRCKYLAPPPPHEILFTSSSPLKFI
jgi:hypothetical protein